MCLFFFFKQKTAYEIKECDWSSDVCSSDLKDVLKNFVVIILRSGRDNKRVKKRIEISKKIIKRSKAKIIEIEAMGDNLLAQFFSLIYTDRKSVV